VADVVAQRDQVCAALEQVAEEADAGGRLRVENFKQLRDL
jgi:hypothetical protein